MNDTPKLLKRTNLKSSLDTFLVQVQKLFPSIGIIKNTLSIMEGYEDANFILETSTGKFVLKIFLEERTLENVESYAKILRECKNVGVPTTEILLDFNDGLGFVENNNSKTYFILTKYFEGENFQNIMPTLNDIKIVTVYLSKLNTLNFPVVETYDSWGNKNFGKEYKLNKNKITPEQDALVKPIYEEFMNLDLHGFSKSVIHGDMQRKHVKKNANGKYCILDFGCMAFGPKAIDLSTFLAWFCLQEDTWKDVNRIYDEVLYEYDRIHYLSEIEIERLPILIKSSYSAYFLKTSVLINSGDKSKETLDWHNRAKKMLELTKNWKND
jgi:Ser/Thr protein kinase RdoA (MazF antagonist)